MDWNVLVINLLGILLTGSWVTVRRSGKGTLYLSCALYHQTACRILTSFNRDFSCLWVSCTEVLLTMQRGDVSCAKTARVLSRNGIREIVMDSDSDEDKYHTDRERGATPTFAMVLPVTAQSLFKILQPFQTFGSRWSHCEIQGKGIIQTVHPEKTQTFRHQNVQTMRLYWIHIWYECLAR